MLRFGDSEAIDFQRNSGGVRSGDFATKHNQGSTNIYSGLKKNVNEIKMI